MKLICQMCGSIFGGGNISAKYCPKCRRIRDRESRRKYRWEKYGVPKPTAQCVCMVCGKSYQSESRSLRRNKTCSPECAMIKRREHIGKQWILISPVGDQYIFRNLRLWIKNNTKLFKEKPDTVYCSLIQNKCKRSKNSTEKTVGKWKGWLLCEAKDQAKDVHL